MSPILVFLRLIPKDLLLGIYPYIFLSKELYEDYVSGKPGPITLAWIMHEKAHTKRQYEMGTLRFGIRYLISKSFCFEEEMIAIHDEMLSYKVSGISFDTAIRAQILSGNWLFYRHCVKYDIAKKRLDEEWQKIIGTTPSG